MKLPAWWNKRTFWWAFASTLVVTVLAAGANYDASEQSATAIATPTASSSKASETPGQDLKEPTPGPTEENPAPTQAADTNTAASTTLEPEKATPAQNPSSPKSAVAEAPSPAAPVAPKTPPPPPAPGPAPKAAEAKAAPGSALATLASLAVKNPDRSQPYRRANFGKSWVDIDKNRCNTRNDILNRDLKEKTHVPGTCKVDTGVLNDPYTGRQLRFQRGERTSELIQIDHVISLSDAWVTGAKDWSGAKRINFANDPLNLLAVDGPTNQRKSDKDAASWLPPNRGFRCPYVARQVTIKAKYGLWATPAEAEAMKRVLTACPNEPLANGGAAVAVPAGPAAPAAPAPAPAPVAPKPARPTPVPAGPAPARPAPAVSAPEVSAPPAAPAPAAPVAPAPVPAPAPAPGASKEVYFKNCAEARAAGAAPLYKGQPGYREKMDGDRDGIACE